MTALILLLILLRTSCFFGNLLGNNNTEPAVFFLLAANFKIKKSSLKLLPFLKTESKSFFFARRLVLGNIIIAADL